MCIEWSPHIGMTAIINTSTPMPPIHCVNMRQNMQPRLRTSTCGSIVAPVVVKPETVSNTASR